ncbi:hypothetical protein E4U61_001015 [Claviceps capensis]|nr:hypothetical protein E4U61_001015 [Claviceps capensis]
MYLTPPPGTEWDRRANSFSFPVLNLKILSRNTALEQAVSSIGLHAQSSVRKRLRRLAESTTLKPLRIAKATAKKRSNRKSFWTVERVVDAMVCAHLRSPESQNHMVALRDIARDDYGFSTSLATALLRWIQKDPETNAAMWNTIQDTTKKFHFLSKEPGFEDVEFPSNLE